MEAQSTTVHPASPLGRVRSALATAQQASQGQNNDTVVRIYTELSSELGQLSQQAERDPECPLEVVGRIAILERRMQQLRPAYDAELAARRQRQEALGALQEEERRYLQTLQLVQAELAAIDEDERLVLAEIARRRATAQNALLRICGDPHTPALMQERTQRSNQERAQQARHEVRWLLPWLEQGYGAVGDLEAVRGLAQQLHIEPPPAQVVEEVFRVLRPIVHRYQEMQAR